MQHLYRNIAELRRNRNRRRGAAFHQSLTAFLEMELCMSLLRAGLFAACLIGCAGGAQAGSEPARACAGAGVALERSDLVLGHFRGGRIVRAPDGVPLIVWKDEYSCFSSRRACDGWQRQMNIAYRNVEGDRTCLPIR